MTLIGRLAAWERSIKRFARSTLRDRRLRQYLILGRRPWSVGYDDYKSQFIESAIRDESLLGALRAGRSLPPGYGFRLDERCIEIPWALARVGTEAGRLLDAGSSLNHDFALNAPALAAKKLTIATLAPEGQAYWQRGISYVYGDLRTLDFRDDWFDAIICISTIEHVGMDNALYSDNLDISRPGGTQEFASAVGEMRRVLKPGGALYVTFPYGKYENHGFFQQFDAARTDLLIEAFGPSQASEMIFRYDPAGWTLSDRGDCAGCEYFNVHKTRYFGPESSIDYPQDYAASARAVACLELVK